MRFKWLMQARWKNLFIAVMLVCSTLLLVTYGYYHRGITAPLDFGTQIWKIEEGDSVGKIAMQLEQRGIIDHSLLLRVLARLHGRSKQVRPGEYLFPKDITLQEFLDHIVAGKAIIGIKTTILEGWNFRQMREHLRTLPKLEQVTAEWSDEQIMAELGYPNLHPEGRFFPDTYHYTAGQNDLVLYRQAFRLMQERLDEAWESRAEDLFITSKDEMLILASIIQKESYIEDEQGEIAGVFYNRLKKGMRLQADPTVIYGLGTDYKGNITRTHLKTDTPYNTYTRKGLTPTPISLPSWSALLAAAQPQATDAFYFVATGDGRHHFSQTLAQHNKAVKAYVRKIRNANKTETQ